jgi:hypothetical protein
VEVAEEFELKFVIGFSYLTYCQHFKSEFLPKKFVMGFLAYFLIGNALSLRHQHSKVEQNEKNHEDH